MKPNILTVGHACIDIVHLVPQIPKPNTKIASREVTISIGGNAANAAAALSDFGAKVELCSALGSDSHPFTRILSSLLLSHGVGMNWCTFDEMEPCSSSTIMVTPDGERAIMNWQGQRVLLAVKIPDDLHRYHMIFGDTYRLPHVNAIFTKANEANIPTMLDVDAAFDNIQDIPAASHVWFSQEAWNTYKIPITELQDRFGGIVGITDGHKPVAWVGTDKVVHHLSPPVVAAKNTLGAGDVFRARLGLGICIGEPLEQAVEAACYAACDHITGRQLKKLIKDE